MKFYRIKIENEKLKCTSRARTRYPPSTLFRHLPLTQKLADNLASLVVANPNRLTSHHGNHDDVTLKIVIKIRIVQQRRSRGMH